MAFPIAIPLVLGLGALGIYYSSQDSKGGAPQPWSPWGGGDDKWDANLPAEHRAKLEQMIANPETSSTELLTWSGIMGQYGYPKAAATLAREAARRQAAPTSTAPPPGQQQPNAWPFPQPTPQPAPPQQQPPAPTVPPVPGWPTAQPGQPPPQVPPGWPSGFPAPPAGFPTPPGWPTPPGFPSPTGAKPEPSVYGLPQNAYVADDRRVHYIVQSGDYGAKIAKKFKQAGDSAVPALVKENPGKGDWTKMPVGTDLLIPEPWFVLPPGAMPTTKPAGASSDASLRASRRAPAKAAPAGGGGAARPAGAAPRPKK